MAYAATFYANFGTYSSFGHNKLIPGLEKEKFWDIFRTNPEYPQEGFYRAKVDQLIPLIEKEIFEGDGLYTTINYPDKGNTAYFSRNMTDSDHELLDRFLASENVNILNTRCFKEETRYIVTIACVDIHEKEC